MRAVCGPALCTWLGSAIDSDRCPLCVFVDPPEVIGVQDIAFERFQHRPNLDPVGAADVKQTASSADGEIFVFEDIHYHRAAAAIGDVPRHPGLLHPPHRFSDPARCTRRTGFGKWQGWDMPPLPIRRRGRRVNLPHAAGKRRSSPRIRFRFNAEKAYEAILWRLGETAPLDLHAVLKACDFADKSHPNEFGRPVFGAAYRAMKHGPVPLEIYEMLKGEPLWLYETGRDKFPWRVRGRGRIEPVGKTSAAQFRRILGTRSGTLEGRVCPRTLDDV
jgi:hypothetical protein